MATLLFRLGRTAFRRRWSVLAAWLVVLVAVAACAMTFGGQTDDQFTIPGSQSQKALDAMAKTFPASAGTNAQVVFEAPAGHRVTEPRYAAAIHRVMTQAGHTPQVAADVDPLHAKIVSPDGRVALGQVKYTVSKTDLRPDSLDALQRAVRPAEQTGLTVDVGGPAVSAAKKSGGSSEVIGIAVALVVLTVTFGSLLAAGMPLLTAVTGVAISLLAVKLLTGAFTISSTAPSLAAMLGLAVGIDYALFIVSRHRSQLAAGMDAEESAATATATAGSAVVFAGLTVVIALAGLSVVGIPFLTVMGLCAVAAVLIAVMIAITLLPALMGLAGERLRPKPTSRTARRELAAADPADGTHRAASSGERWGRLVTRRPLVTLAVIVVGMLAVALPAHDLDLALPDNSSATAGTGPREAYDAVTRSFGPGFNGPLIIYLHGQDAPAVQRATQQVSRDLNGLPDVLTVGKPVVNPRSAAALIQVVPRSGPLDDRTTTLVKDIRGRAPNWQRQAAVTVAVTGTTALNIDVSDRLGASLVPFAAVVVGLSLLLLLVVFRSLVIPVKAAIGFLLSVAATFGTVVAVFEWGWLAGVVGVAKTGPVVSFLPIILMAVLFGLAMDYEVFLVSRMREAHVHGRSPRAAIGDGMRHAARVVTGAAIIMLGVFCGFVPGASPTFKPIAFALATGVLLDAFVIRMTFVPAVLALVDKAAWWLPDWLERLLPRLDIEGEGLRKHAEESSDQRATLNA